ncbi:MAG: drug/metabolite transporter (DMT)-like permease, partial [Candidatus Azotimanducaceae bacterium]
PFYWKTPNQNEVVWLLIISLTGIMGHLLLIKALQLAPAVILQPFNYFVLLWATGIGYIVYDEILPVQTLAGAALVVASGIFIGYREYKLYQRERRAKVALVATKHS